jgi:hypothetical protein
MGQSNNDTIKANELRLGNKIAMGIGVATVLAIRQNIVETDVAYMYHKNLEGIPISPKWLERCGFDIQPNGLYWREPMGINRIEYKPYEKCAIWTTERYPEIGHGVNAPARMDYVHQLQNLYFFMMDQELPVK